jgi:hypothetical protein
VARLRQQRERERRIDQPAHGDLRTDPRACPGEAGVAERGARAGTDQHDIVRADLLVHEIIDCCKRDVGVQLTP